METSLRTRLTRSTSCPELLKMHPSPPPSRPASPYPPPCSTLGEMFRIPLSPRPFVISPLHIPIPPFPFLSLSQPSPPSTTPSSIHQRTGFIGKSALPPSTITQQYVLMVEVETPFYNKTHSFIIPPSSFTAPISENSCSIAICLGDLCPRLVRPSTDLSFGGGHCEDCLSFCHLQNSSLWGVTVFATNRKSGEMKVFLVGGRDVLGTECVEHSGSKTYEVSLNCRCPSSTFEKLNESYSSSASFLPSILPKFEIVLTSRIDLSGTVDYLQPSTGDGTRNNQETGPKARVHLEKIEIRCTSGRSDGGEGGGSMPIEFEESLLLAALDSIFIE